MWSHQCGWLCGRLQPPALSQILDCLAFAPPTFHAFLSSSFGLPGHYWSGRLGLFRLQRPVALHQPPTLADALEAHQKMAVGAAQFSRRRHYSWPSLVLPFWRFTRHLPTDGNYILWQCKRKRKLFCSIVPGS
jgi:hypothetical protein